MKKVCLFTATRAEFGLLLGLAKKVKSDKDLTLQLLVSGSHLAPDFGNTFTEIIDQGLKIDKKVEILMSSDTGVGVAKSMGLGLISFSEALQELRPDVLVLLGDRFELIAVAMAAAALQIPIAHLHGGELSEGAIDDAIRHSVTKISHLHFTSSKQHRKRVIQLGESPERVFDVGALGVDAIKSLKLLNRGEIEDRFNFTFNKKNLMLTFHPTTLEDQSGQAQTQELLRAIDEIEDLQVIITMPNADMGGKVIFEELEKYTAKNSHKVALFKSMGQLGYLSTLAQVDGIVGNSSSGIIEAPSFRIGTINVGDRQKGRLSAKSVIDVEASYQGVAGGLEKLYSPEFQQEVDAVKNPYEGKDTVHQIYSILKNTDLSNILKKSFHDIPLEY